MSLLIVKLKPLTLTFYVGNLKGIDRIYQQNFMIQKVKVAFRKKIYMNLVTLQADLDE